MKIIKTCELASQTDNEISALCSAFIKAMERSEPFSTDWKIAQWSLHTLMRERRHRLRRISPGWG